MAVAGLAALMLLVAIAGVGLTPVPARADGDPASDVLLGQDVFLPYSAISASAQRRLYAVTDAARQAGYPVRIALIGARTDLGVVPSLFGKPGTYARFLSTEVAGVVNGPVLVVMPGGFGLAVQGKPLSVSALRGVAIAPGTDGLAAAGVAATGLLAAAAGHPLPATASPSTVSPGASPETIGHARTAILALAALASAAIAAALLARSRRRLRSR
jgi:hypothetical protein